MPNNQCLSRIRWYQKQRQSVWQNKIGTPQFSDEFNVLANNKSMIEVYPLRDVETMSLKFIGQKFYVKFVYPLFCIKKCWITKCEKHSTWSVRVSAIMLEKMRAGKSNR